MGGGGGLKSRTYQAIYYGLPVLFLIASVAVLNSGRLQNRWLGLGQAIPSRLAAAADHSVAERWPEAEAALADAERQWAHARRRFQFSASTEDITTLDRELAELRGAVEAQDPGQIRMTHRKVQALWENLVS